MAAGHQTPRPPHKTEPAPDLMACSNCQRSLALLDGYQALFVAQREELALMRLQRDQAVRLSEVLAELRMALAAIRPLSGV
jgi:hypothetical protein